MAFTHGSKARFHLGTLATPTVLVDVSTYFAEVQQPRTVDSAETSVFGNLFKTYVPGLSDGTFSLTGRYDPVIDAQLHDLLGVASVNYMYQPQGATTGLVRYTGSLFLTSYQVTTSVTEAGTFQTQGQLITAVTRATNP